MTGVQTCALPISQKLYNVYIGYNNIGIVGMKAIAESLKINNSIRSIDLSNLY